MWILTDHWELGYEYQCSLSGLKIDTPVKNYLPKGCCDCPCNLSHRCNEYSCSLDNKVQE